MAIQKTKKRLTNQQAIEQIKAIYQDFLNKIAKIEKSRDEKISTIIKKADERQIKEIRKKLEI